MPTETEARRPFDPFTKLSALAPIAAFVFLLAWAPVRAQLVDVNPDGDPGEPRFGGRGLGLTVNPFNANVVYLASEKGGFFLSVDGGTHWSHIDDIPVSRARDILFDPRDPNIIIASGRNNWMVPNQGGIWRSVDAGATWSKPEGSNPGCGTQASSWDIAIPDHASFHENVFVATDCGIAISDDSGATWDHVDPCRETHADWCKDWKTYFDVEARVVVGQIQLDVCGDEGYFRSTNGGSTWSAPDPDSPARVVTDGPFNPCQVATAPADPDTVFLANYSGREPEGFCLSRLMENDSAGGPGGWVDMEITDKNCREPWVVTHPDLQGSANRFRVYFGTSKRVKNQRCRLTTNPRCKAGFLNWPVASSGAHSDPSDIAFDTSAPNGCPIVLSTDGGISTSKNCGSSWKDGNRGLHALDVVEMAGTSLGDGTTEVYLGTQDNGFYVTEDNASTWRRPVSADGYNVLADPVPPARVFHRRCYGCKNRIANPGLKNRANFGDPPGELTDRALVTQFGPESYVFLTHDGGDPQQWTAQVTTDEGGSWNQLGPSPLPGRGGGIRSSGPPASPTFYLRLRVDDDWRIYRMTGSLDSSATLTEVSTGLVDAGTWSVDPVDPLLLYAADRSTNEMKSSVDGGLSWSPDTELTNRVTRGGTFEFRPARVGFNPTNETILVGTRSAGLIVSVNDGQSWGNLAGTEIIPQPAGFFFDADNEAIYVASRGRGVWRLDLPDAHIQVPGPLDFGATCLGALRTQTLNVCNTGTDNLVIDPITSSSSRFSVTEPTSGYPVTISSDFCFPFQVVFSPTFQSPTAGTLAIPSNDLETPETEVEISGSGTIPDIRVTGSTDFGVASNWRPTERALSVCNTGGCDLSVSSAVVSCADFTLVSNPFPASVGPGSCLDLVVGFTPVLPGSKSCNLTINSSDPDTPVVTRILTASTPPLFSLQAGISSPQGALNASARQGSTFSLAFVRPFRPKLAWNVRLGFTSFDGRSGFEDTDGRTLHSNVKFTTNPLSPARFFLNGGAGLYHFDPGDFEAGLNFGLGVDVPVGPRFTFEASLNYHNALTASPDLEFIQVQLGFLVSF